MGGAPPLPLDSSPHPQKKAIFWPFFWGEDPWPEAAQNGTFGPSLASGQRTRPGAPKSPKTRSPAKMAILAKMALIARVPPGPCRRAPWPDV